MAVTINIENYNSLNVKERTILNAAGTPNQTDFVVVNNQNITANDYALIGAPGSEGAEILLVSAITGNTDIITAAAKLPHSQYNDVTILKGNQIRIYRAPNVSGLQPDDTTFILLTTVNIDPDQLSTSYTDSAGSSAYWYKFTYYNQTSLAESTLADSASVRGGGASNYCSLDDIRQDSGLKSQWIGDTTVDTWRQSAQAEINGALNGLFQIPFAQPVSPYIKGIAIRLAAGNLMMDQYDQFTDIYNRGDAKVKAAQADLLKIQTGQMGITDAIGTDLAVPTAGEFNMLPDDSSTPRMFSTADVAKGTRRY